MADYKTPQWLLPNEKNLAYPASGAETGSGLSEDRHSLYSMDFDGTSYIDLNDNNIINGFTSVSFSFWVNVTTPGLYDGILCSRNGSDYILIFLDNVSGSDFKIKIQQNSTSGGSATITTSPTLTSGNWYNVVCTGTVGGKWDLHINGDNTGQVQGASNITAITQSADFIIGSDTLLAGRYLNGLIDEIAIYNKALNQSEIDALSVADAPANIMGLNEKPIAYYPLGEQAQMGSANWSFPNGSLQSHVIDFDGTDYISAGNVLDQSGTDAFSISSWFYLNSGGSNTIVSKMNSSFVGYQLYINAANKLKFLLQGTGNLSATGNTTLSLNTWYNVILAYDGSGTTGGINLYLNGATETFVGSGSNSGGVSNSENFEIGARTGAIDAIDGKLSNVAFWTSDQTTNKDNIYNNGSPQSTYTTTPRAWWKLNAANSSYVYPWLISMTGDTDYGSGNGCFTTGGVLKWIDTQSQLLSEDEYFTFTTQEVSYSGSITLSTTGGNYQSASSQLEYSLEYKVDQGSWTVWKTQVVSSGTSNTAWTATDVVVNPTSSVQVRLRATGGLFGSSQFTLNDITIGGLYTETFATADIGYTNNTITQPPVDWTFIDTETPAPNYTSALDFVSADSDYIEVANNSSLQITDNLTLSCWINADNVSGTNSIIDKFYDGADRSYMLRLQSTTIRLSLGNASGSASVTYQSTATLSNNVWYHVATTFSSTDNEVKIYINGSLDSTHSKTDLISSNNEELRIGAGYNLLNYFDGSISNCSIYNSSLSASQIQTLYNSGTPETVISFSPVSWWKLDNTTTGIQDSGSASNNGTNNGTTQIATNVLISNNGESDTLPTSALTPSDLQFESPYSNYSLDFAGSQDIDCGNNSVFNNTFTGNAFSFSAWIKSSSNVAYDGIVCFSSRVQSFLNSNKIKIWLEGSSGYIVTAFTSNTTILSDTWYHIVFTRNGNDNTLYINGVSDNTVTSTGNVASTTGNFRIGSFNGSQYFWDGNLDEVALWNTALTQAQVTQVYNNGYPGNLTSLSPISWWRLGEDAYFVNNNITIPNQITSGPTGTGSGTQTAVLVGNAPGSYANGSGTNLVVTDRIGDAPESTTNSVSINMIPSNRISYPAGYVPTQVDNAFSMEFDGVDDYFDLGTGLDIFRYNINESYSVSLWYKATASGGFKTIINLGANNYRFCLLSATIGRITFGAGNGSTVTVTYNWMPTAGAINDGQWHHICIVQDSSGGVPNLTAYVDGSSSGSAAGTTPAITQNNNRIGDGHYGGVEAGIDEVAIFNYALSARQVKQDIYEGTTAGGKTADLNNISNLTAPVAWYRMGD